MQCCPNYCVVPQVKKQRNFKFFWRFSQVCLKRLLASSCQLFCPSVLLSPQIILVPSWKTFLEFDFVEIQEDLPRNQKFLSRTKNIGPLFPHLSTWVCNLLHKFAIIELLCVTQYFCIFDSDKYPTIHTARLIVLQVKSCLWELSATLFYIKSYPLLCDNIHCTKVTGSLLRTTLKIGTSRIRLMSLDI